MVKINRTHYFILSGFHPHFASVIARKSFDMQLSLLSVAISTVLIFDFHPPLDLPVDKIKKCMGNPEADEENEVLKDEQ